MSQMMTRLMPSQMTSPNKSFRSANPNALRLTSVIDERSHRASPLVANLPCQSCRSEQLDMQLMRIHASADFETIRLTHGSDSTQFNQDGLHKLSFVQHLQASDSQVASTSKAPWSWKDGDAEHALSADQQHAAVIIRGIVSGEPHTERKSTFQVGVMATIAVLKIDSGVAIKARPHPCPHHPGLSLIADGCILPVCSMRGSHKACCICLSSATAATHCSWRRNAGVSLQAHLAPIKRPLDVDTVMAELLSNSKIQRATHNMMAYRIWCLSRPSSMFAWQDHIAFSSTSDNCSLQ